MRLLINKIVLLLAILSALAGLAFLGWILTYLFIRGITSFSFNIFINDIIANVLRNLIVGQFVMAGLASVIGIPIGMLADIFLQEYGYNSKFTTLIRDLNDIMVSGSSIVIGDFVYVVICIPTGGSSGFAGSLALAIMMIPIVINTTDNMLSLVPTELREAGIAIGASKYRVILDIIIKAAKVGIMTGLLLAFARIIGETAPLLFTSGTSNYFSLDLTSSFPSLTVSIYDLANDPVQASRDLAWAASFILTVLVLMINLLGRYITRHKG